MARLAKARVHAALTHAAEQLKEAGGPDKRISREDMATAGDVNKDKLERHLINMFGKFCDHRDHKKGATLGHEDIDRSLAYAKEKLVDRLDKDPKNGLSHKEINKMSTTGQLAAMLARRDF